MFDSCNNSQFCEQLITIQDTMLPTIVCPADVEADGCSTDDVLAATGWAFSTDSVFTDEVTYDATDAVSDAADNCGVLRVAYYDVITNTSCPIEITRTWTVFDSCNNSQFCEQLITIQDTMLPTIVCPADVEADGCSTDDVLAATGWAFSTDSVFTDEVTYDATDAVSDAADNCGVLRVAYYDVITNTSCPIEITRTWTVFDSCNNSQFCEQLITIQDTMLPTIVCPADVEADGCSTDDVLAATGWAFSTDSVFTDEVTYDATDAVSDAADNCGVLRVAYYDVITNTSCPIEITRTWTVFDSCNNSQFCEQLITIQDTMLPTIVCPADVEADGCSTDDVLAATGWAFSTDSVFTDEVTYDATDAVSDAADNCGVLRVAYYDVITNTSCPIEITRTWTVFDSCNNSQFCEQLITIQDTMLPTIVCPADVEADGCSTDDVLAATGWAFSTDSVFTDEVTYDATDAVSDAADNCGVLRVAYYDVITNTSCPIEITRTWTVFDSCNNSQFCEQLITIQDTMLPTIVCPADVEADGCSTDDVLAATGWAFSTDSVFTDEVTYDATDAVSDAADNCGVLRVAYYDVITNTSCPIEITRTWTVFDSCNNSQFCEQLITIQDTMLPTIVCPADVEADGCSTDDVLAATGWAFSTDSVFTDEVTYDATDAVSDAADNCGVLRVAYYDVITNTSCPIEITRTWTVFDSCNNSQFCEQLITIQDTMLPTIVCPADVEADGCSTDDVLAATGWAFSTDSVFTDEVTYDATDAVSDAADNCGVLRVAYYDVITNTSCPIEITRTWTVFDSCNNSQFCEQLITIQDTMLPTIVCPADVEADGCSTDDVLAATGWAFSTDSVFTDEVTYDATDAVSDAADNCGVLRVAYYDVITNTSCPIEITRTWTVFDSCNNSQFCEQLITIQDTMLPTIVCPADVEADGCSTDDVITASNFAFSTDTVFMDELIFEGLTTGSVDDNCGVQEVYYVDVLSQTACPIIVMRTWSVLDTCGNLDTCIQIISIQDTIPPQFICPSDIVVSCDAPTDTSATGVPMVIENCNSYTLDFTDSIESNDPCAGNYTIYRTWSAEDGCMNVLECIQVITVQDTSLPIISCPPDTTIACDATTDTTNLGVATATDNCGPPPFINYQDSLVPGVCGGNSILYRIWQAQDDCGNTTSCIQTITIEDLASPIINNVPGDTIVPCDGVPPPPAIGIEITVVDNCDTVSLLFTEDTLPGVCENEYILQRVWVGIDDCSNEARDTQTITVQGCQPEVQISINPNPICLDEDVLLDALITGNYPNPSYQWQFFDGSSWNDIPGANTIPFSINGVTLSEGGFYRLIVADNPANLGNLQCSAISDSLELLINLPDSTVLNQQICEGQAYDFNGMQIDSSGTYIDSLSTSQGCDSILILNLEVLEVLYTNLSDSICEGESVTFGGRVLDSTGIYADTIPSSIGCDSIITFDLSVFPIFLTMVGDTICEGESYDFLGLTLDSTGTYVDTLQTVNGCDSVITLDLLVNPVVSYAYDTTICDSEVYNFGNQILDSTGTYTDTLSSATGCDSIVTLILTVFPTYNVTFDEQICDGGTFDFNGRMLSSAGTYDTLLQTIDGCDSMVTVNLSVLNILYTDLTDSICEGESVLFMGQVLDTTGIYRDTLPSSLGCDSIITLDLTVFPTYSVMNTDTICAGQTYDFLGVSLDSTGIYVDTVQTIDGCDSVVTLELLVNPAVTFAFDTSICDIETYTFGNQALDSTGIYVDTLVSATGCDSIVTLTLTVYPTYNVEVNEQICDGGTIDFNGRILSSAGTYDTLLQTMNGCDSMVTLNLTVLDILYTSLTDSICEGETVLFMGQVLDSTGLYQDTLQSSIGCDSVITFDLTVFPIYSVLVEDTICAGETYDFLGMPLDSSGTYVDTIPTTNGCDSIVTLELLVNPTVTHAYDTSICDVETYTFGGQVLDSSGVYVDTLVSATGCDSILTLTLTVHPTYDVTIDEQICDGSIYDFNGRPLSAGGTYDTLLQTMNGCDSMVTLNLTVLDILTTDLTDSICEGESIVFDGQTLTQTDTVSFTTISSIGCDSVVTMYLTVLPINTEMVSDTICEGEIYDFNGAMLTVSGSYTDTVAGTNGCDSIVTLELLVNPTVTHAYDL